MMVDRSILLPGSSIGFLHGVAPRPGSSRSAEWSLVCHQVEWLCVWSARFGAWCSDLMILYQLQSLFLMDLLLCPHLPDDVEKTWRSPRSQSVSKPGSQSISHSANLPLSQPVSQSTIQLASQSIRHSASQSVSHLATKVVSQPAR